MEIGINRFAVASKTVEKVAGPFGRPFMSRAVSRIGRKRRRENTWMTWNQGFEYKSSIAVCVEKIAVAGDGEQFGTALV